ncbi:GSCOCG00003754001-RA-CDS [Cotesia congregata]|nr:GSCOCG00003754001-RA-CDS [Cotesia congregata]
MNEFTGGTVAQLSIKILAHREGVHLPVRSCLCRRHSERFEGPHGPRQWLRLLRRSTCSKRGSNSKFSTERTKSKGGASLMSPPGHPEKTKCRPSVGDPACRRER